MRPRHNTPDDVKYVTYSCPALTSPASLCYALSTPVNIHETTTGRHPTSHHLLKRDGGTPHPHRIHNPYTTECA